MSKARAAMWDPTERTGTSSERAEVERLQVGVVDRDDGLPDVVVSAAEFLRLVEEDRAKQAATKGDGTRTAR